SNISVAVKHIRLITPRARAAFAKEVEMLAPLTHPALPRLYDAFEESTDAYLVSSFFAGDTLADLLRRRDTPFALDLVLEWADQLLDVLMYLQSRNPAIVHGDIKPQNLKLLAHGAVALLDFGVASWYGTGIVQRTQGYTLTYAAPEHIQGLALDGRSDLYALAATLVELLTGTPPPSALERAAAYQRGDPDPFQGLIGGIIEVPDALAAMLRLALALDPAQRPVDALALRLALHAARNETATVVSTQPLAATAAPQLLSEHEHVPHNVPAAPTPLIGREALVAQTTTMLLRGDARLVTLTGPGGVGKTRLAMQIAERLVSYFPDGVVFVSLAAVAHPDRVAEAVAATLAIPLTAGCVPKTLLQEYVKRKRMLLVLDNFEHVLAAALLVADLLAAAAGLVIVTTSREVLHVRGEHTIVVPPLTFVVGDLPANVSELRQYAAIELFVRSARAADQSFDLTPSNAALIAAICARLDGLPLAIELAAVRMRTLTATQLYALLEQSLDLLVDGPRDLPQRQQTLRTTVTWSVELLPSFAQAVFATLGVFVGSFDAQAVTFVLADQAGLAMEDVPTSADTYWQDPAVHDALEALTRINLVQRISTDPGVPPRYSLFETVKDVALERLKTVGQFDHAVQRHTQYFVTLVEAGAQALASPGAAPWLTKLAAEHDNLRAVLARAVTEDQPDLIIRLVAVLGRYWWLRGHIFEGQRWTELACTFATPSTPPLLRAKLHFSAAAIAYAQSDYQAAQDHFRQELALRTEIQDAEGAALAMSNLAAVLADSGQMDAAVRYWEQSLQQFRMLDLPYRIAHTLSNLGVAAFNRGDPRQAINLYEESLALRRKVGDTHGIARALHLLATALHGQGEHERPLALLRESLAIRLRIHDQGGIAECLEALSSIAGTERPWYAASLLGAADKLRRSSGVALPVPDQPAHQRQLALLRTHMGEVAFQAAYAAGRQTPINTLVALEREATTLHDGAEQ
ncbi:MAG: protein kinase domain-containing protein, partial [Oscillochloridaceae bacterium umkhey_bin13]